MVVDSLLALAETVKISTPEQGSLLIERYGNDREAHGIETGWKKCADLHRKLKTLHAKKFRDAMLDYDEENRSLSLEEFIRFFASVEDELKVTMEFGDEQSRLFAINLHDFMWNRLGNIKVDRRFIFQPE